MAGRIWIPGGGGGADLDVVTAGAGEILAGKVIVDKDGNPLVGTMPNQGAKTASLNCGGSYIIPAGYHNGNGKVTANSLASQTSATATAAQILSGKTAWVNGAKVTGTIASLAGGTKTPTTSQQTISCKNKYMTSDIVIPAFTLPAASSIKKGTIVTIYGKSVTGTLQQYISPPSVILNGSTWDSNITSTGFSSNNSSLNISKETSNYFFNGVNTTAYARTNSAFDLTDYKYLKATIYVSNYNGLTHTVHIAVSTSPNYTGLTAASSNVSNANEATVISDITNLSGMYYVYVVLSMQSAYASCQVSSLELANS